MYNYFVNLIKKHKASEYIIIKFYVIPIFGIILSLMIFISFTPLYFSKYVKLFIYYNEPFEKIPLNISQVNKSTLNLKDQIVEFLANLDCVEDQDSPYSMQKYKCTLKNGLKIQIIITDFPTDINLSFPKYYEFALQKEYKFLDFFENKYKESIALKSEMAEIFTLPKVKFLSGYNQIYFINYDHANIKIYSIFYDFGKLYLFKYIVINKNFSELVNLIKIIESN